VEEAVVREGVLDTLGMFDLAAGLPEQVADAAYRARGFGGFRDAASVEQIVVIGMGGSGMAGEVVAAVAAPMLAVPVLVVKSYECPAYVDSGSLVFAISASGNTEETLQAATDASASGATLVVISGGGKLAESAAGWNAPVIEVPPEIPQPRAALGAMAIPPLVVLEEMGLYRGGHHWIEAAVQQLQRRRDELHGAGDSSRAAAMARRIGRTFPLIHGSGAVGATAANRWRTQVNENAKAPAFSNAQPEVCHNEVCGWGQHGDVTRQLITAIALRHDGEHPQMDRRFELVGELLREVVADVLEVRADGDGDLAQLFDLILFGDYVSLWMAAEAGIDPGPIPAIDELKERLGAP
jgi:glucose/mannose-6-phosphate isomerase